MNRWFVSWHPSSPTAVLARGEPECRVVLEAEFEKITGVMHPRIADVTEDEVAALTALYDLESRVVYHPKTGLRSSATDAAPGTYDCTASWRAPLILSPDPAREARAREHVVDAWFASLARAEIQVGRAETQRRYYVAHDAVLAILRHKNAAGLAEWRTRSWTKLKASTACWQMLPIPTGPEIVDVHDSVMATFRERAQWGWRQRAGHGLGFDLGAGRVVNFAPIDGAPSPGILDVTICEVACEIEVPRWLYPIWRSVGGMAPGPGPWT